MGRGSGGGLGGWSLPPHQAACRTTQWSMVCSPSAPLLPSSVCLESAKAKAEEGYTFLEQLYNCGPLVALSVCESPTYSPPWDEPNTLTKSFRKNTLQQSLEHSLYICKIWCCSPIALLYILLSEHYPKDVLEPIRWQWDDKRNMKPLLAPLSNHNSKFSWFSKTKIFWFPLMNGKWLN